MAHLRGEVPALRQRLSNRERQVAELMAEGKRNKEIATALGLTEGTVKVYGSRLMQKLGLSNRTQIAMWWRGRPKT